MAALDACTAVAANTGIPQDKVNKVFAGLFAWSAEKMGKSTSGTVKLKGLLKARPPKRDPVSAEIVVDLRKLLRPSHMVLAEWHTVPQGVWAAPPECHTKPSKDQAYYGQLWRLPQPRCNSEAKPCCNSEAKVCQANAFGNRLRKL